MGILQSVAMIIPHFPFMREGPSTIGVEIVGKNSGLELSAMNGSKKNPGILCVENAVEICVTSQTALRDPLHRIPGVWHAKEGWQCRRRENVNAADRFSMSGSPEHSPPI